MFQCKCNGSKKVNVNKSYGCKKGGFPDCPKENDLFCKDGAPATANNIMKYWATAVRQTWQNEAFEPCVCADGSHPK